MRERPAAAWPSIDSPPWQRPSTPSPRSAAPGSRPIDPAIAELLGREAERQRDQLELIASRELHLAGRAWRPSAPCSPTSTPRATPASATTAAARSSTRSSGWPSSARSRCSAPSTPTSSRTRARRPTWPPTTRCSTSGDTVLGLRLDHGGHLTHGHRVNFSGRNYHFVHYGVSPETERIDIDDVRRLAKEHRPKLIVTGASAYPRRARLRRLPRDRRRGRARCSWSTWRTSPASSPPALHPNPVEWADIVTSTTHKTLAGPRAGFVLCRAELGAEDRLRGVPRAPGRAALPRHRGQGGVLRDRRDAGVPRVPARRCARTPTRWRRRCSAAATGSCPAAPTRTSCCSTCATARGRARTPRTACTPSA